MTGSNSKQHIRTDVSSKAAKDHNTVIRKTTKQGTPWYKSQKVLIILGVIIAYGAIFAFFIAVTPVDDDHHSGELGRDKKAENVGEARASVPSVFRSVVENILYSNSDGATNSENQNNEGEGKARIPICPYQSLNDLTPEERHPQKGHRHMVDPPKDTNVSLVCCSTTAGPWSILVHHGWAPNGSQRFMEMVESHYFDTPIPLMRCVKNFICQFGLSGGTKLQYKFAQTIQDDPNWLPEGKDFRQNSDGVKRFAKGYMAYAGAGPNSRDNQLIVALKGNGPLGGGSPWEVPWGELVGQHSFDTLDKVYTGYGENGPKQGLLWKPNSLERVKTDFPNLDYITSCWVVDRSQ